MTRDDAGSPESLAGYVQSTVTCDADLTLAAVHGRRNPDIGASKSNERLGAPLPQRDPARYQILAEHGRGGLGRIFRARDKELGRDVALKELLQPSHRSEARFLREALVTARLEHPGIVPVHEAGHWPDGTPFYVMKLVAGRPLDELLAAAQDLGKRLALLPHLIAVADAIAYAHDRKIIHRDLKPSNVIVGEFGETIVIDWGLAKELTEPVEVDEPPDPYRTSATPNLTVAGTILGTPAYMSPEQARGDAVDTRSDVYSIGAMLFQLCAGELPRVAQASYDQVHGPGSVPGKCPCAACLASAKGAEPPPAVEPVEPGVPSDLAAIARKAMARDPDDRYPTASELADDLKRFHTGQFVAARHYSHWERVRRWVARRHVAVAAVAVIVAIAVASFAVVLQQRNRARAAQYQERLAREQAEARRNELTLVQARSTLESDPTAAIAWLKTYPDDGADWISARGIAADAIGRGVAKHVLRGHSAPLYRVRFAADGTAVASSGVDSTLRTWDVATGRGSIVADGLGPIGAFALDPRDRWLAHDGADGTVTLLDRHGGQKKVLARHEGIVLDLSFSADGTTLVSAGADGIIWLWDVATLRRRELRAGAAVHRARLDRSGRALASCGADKQLLLWDLDSGRHRSLGSCDASSDIGFTFSRQGDQLAIGHLDGSISVWNRPRDAHVLIRAQADPSTILSLSDDGELVATGDAHGTVTVWETSTVRERARFRVPDAVSWVELSPSGGILVVGTRRGALHVYDLVGGADWQLRGHTRYIAEARFSPDETWIASASGDRSVRIWRVPVARPRVLHGHRKAAFHPVWTTDGRAVSAEGEDGTIRWWDLRSGESHVLTGHENVVFGLLPLHTDDMLVSASWDGTVRLWSRTSGATEVWRGHTGVVRALAVSPVSDLVASGGADGTVRLWAQRGQRADVLGQLDGEVYGLDFSPNGELVGAGDSAGHVRVWDLRGTAARSIHIPNDTVYRLLFTRDGTKLITGGQSGVVRQWGLNDPNLDTILYKQSGSVRALSLSGDGRWLVSGSEDGEVCTIDLASRMLHRHDGHSSRVRAIAQSSRDGWVATGADDGSIRLVQPMSGNSRVLYGHDATVAGLAFSPDGLLFASAGRDGTVRIWPLSEASQDAIVPGVTGAEFRAWLASVTTASMADDVPSNRPRFNPGDGPLGRNEGGQMRKKNVEAQRRMLQVKRETVRLLSVKTADLRNVAGGVVETSDNGNCNTKVHIETR